MPKISKRLWAWLLAAPGISAAVTAIAQTPAPVEARVLFPPSPFMGSDGLAHLAYEIQVTNVYDDSGTLKVSDVEVMDERHRRLLHLDANDVAHAFRPAAKENGPATLGPGKTGTVFVWVTLPPNALPASLTHRIVLADEKNVSSAVDGVPLTVSPPSSLRLGPPLRGGRWLAHEGPGNAQSHHWGSLVAVNGSLTIPQRYAIDFVRIDTDGRAFTPKNTSHGKRLSDWFGFGTPVLAVGKGRVVAARDGQADHEPLTAPAASDALSLNGLFGNYVVIDLGGDAFAAYAHLRKGSVRVTSGQQVSLGEVIGELGESGSSAAPHLHFQVSNAATFEESQGMPYVFDRLSACGTEHEAQLFGLGDPWTPSPCHAANGTCH
ncbi:M23 family metallopeptidase [Luteibacter sp. PPL554]